VRGPSAPRDAFAIDLFGPANGGELDRIAFAVDGIESRHGADLRMWRPEPNGPQGPMQVSAAAAFDVGGGDRFDLQQNRLLGRAYLAQMYRRYGNWADALAAYNWGPGNMDQWIAGGRSADRLPPGVAWYVNRALHDALMSRNAAGL
jgi:Transglycosylase SLT domain